MAAATMIAKPTPSSFSPQPGLLLPEAGLACRRHRSRLCHGLLVPPFLWEDGVPNVHEVNFGGRHGGGTHHEYTHPGRMTVYAQLVMLTDDEYRVAVDGGATAAAQQMLATTQANLNDVWR
jgi:hypothetical protein